MNSSLKIGLIVFGISLFDSCICNALPLKILATEIFAERVFSAPKHLQPFLASKQKRLFSSSKFHKSETPEVKIRPIQADRKTVRILSISGGGIRGLIPLEILEYLEDQVKKPISKQFDIIAGSSTGGIIALALNAEKIENAKDGNINTVRRSSPPYTAKEMIDLYISDCKAIFDGGHGSSHFEEYQRYYSLLSGVDEKRRRLLDLIGEAQEFLEKGSGGYWSKRVILQKLKRHNLDTRGAIDQLEFFKGIVSDSTPLLKQLEKKSNLFNSSHSANGLQSIKSRFGDKRLSQSLSTVLVPAYNIGSATPYLFNSVVAREDDSHDFMMGDVAMATSAAPTYFPPATIYNLRQRRNPMPFHFVDGGVVANNPSLYALATAKNLFPRANDFYLLSLGCGTGPMYEIRKENIGSGGVLSWSPFIITMLMNSSNAYTSEVTNIFMEEVKRMNRQNAPRSVYLSPTNLKEDIANNMDQTSEPDILSIRTAARAFLIEAETQRTLQGVIKELSAVRPYATNDGVLNPKKDLQEETVH